MRGKIVVIGVALLVLAFAGPALAASMDGEPTTPTPTTPAPDPAPPVPKPAPKPAPKSAPRPAPVYHAPVQHSNPTPTPTPTPTPQPTYTPRPAVHHVAKKTVVHHARKKKKHQTRVKHVAVAPKVRAQVKAATVVRASGVPTAAVATSGGDALRRALVITGIGLAALFFLLVVTVPSTAARYTPPGRVLMDHQTDLVLAGLAVLLLTALLFAFAGNS